MDYRADLDGLRALACLAVLAHHTGVPFLDAGNLGVEVFFVLSGYLITQVLAAKRPTLRAFCAARLRRLTPALVALVGATLVAGPLLVPAYAHHGRDAAAALLYVSDIAKLVSAAEWPYYLGHTWSLGIEEKFYLLWPLVFLRWGPTRRVLLLAFVLATAWRFAHYGTDVCRLRFDLHLSGLLLGCAIAHTLRWRIPAWPALAAIGVCMWAFYPDTPNLRLYGVAITEVATAIALLAQPPRWLGAVPLAYLGRLSYGIYLWHYPIAVYLHDQVGGSWQQQTAITAATSIALAALSYHTLEAIFRKGPAPCPKTSATAPSSTRPTRCSPTATTPADSASPSGFSST